MLHNLSHISLKKSLLLLAGILFFLIPKSDCYATTTYVNPETGYFVSMEDDADLLTEEEERKLAGQMKSITAYGNVAFKSISYNYNDTSYYASQYYSEIFGTSSGMLFLIDMDNRNIWIYCDGTIYKVITKSYANTITDNVYTYASDGDYYTCSSMAFQQAFSLLNGQKISQPMKYICNAFLALLIALLLNYFLVRMLSRSKKPSRSALLGTIFAQCKIIQPMVKFVSQRIEYRPSSSGGGGHHSGGGGHSGGGHSGGGGGHSF